MQAFPLRRSPRRHRSRRGPRAGTGRPGAPAPAAAPAARRPPPPPKAGAGPARNAAADAAAGSRRRPRPEARGASSRPRHAAESDDGGRRLGPARPTSRPGSSSSCSAGSVLAPAPPGRQALPLASPRVEVDEAIRTRRTHKAYAPEPLDRETVAELLDLARWAPNHHLTNPWRFRVIGPEALERLKEAAGPEAATKLDRAPTLVVCSCVLSGDAQQDEEDLHAAAVRRLHRAARRPRPRARRLLAHPGGAPHRRGPGRRRPARERALRRPAPPRPPGPGAERARARARRAGRRVPRDDRLAR